MTSGVLLAVSDVRFHVKVKGVAALFTCFVPERLDVMFVCVLSCSVLYWTVLDWTVLYWTVLDWTVLYCSVMQ